MKQKYIKSTAETLSKSFFTLGIFGMLRIMFFIPMAMIMILNAYNAFNKEHYIIMIISLLNSFAFIYFYKFISNVYKYIYENKLIPIEVEKIMPGLKKYKNYQ
jgi:hypothetical protein